MKITLRSLNVIIMVLLVSVSLFIWTEKLFVVSAKSLAAEGINYFTIDDFYETGTHSLNIDKEKENLVITNAVPYTNNFYPAIFADKIYNVDEFPYLYIRVISAEAPTGVFITIDDGERYWLQGNEYGAPISAYGNYFPLKEMFGINGSHKITLGIMWHDCLGSTPCTSANEKRIVLEAPAVTELSGSICFGNMSLTAKDWIDNNYVEVCDEEQGFSITNRVTYQNQFTPTVTTMNGIVNFDITPNLKINPISAEVPYSLGISLDKGNNFIWLIGTATDGVTDTGEKVFSLPDITNKKGEQNLMLGIRWMTWNDGYACTVPKEKNISFSEFSLVSDDAIKTENDVQIRCDGEIGIRFTSSVKKSYLDALAYSGAKNVCCGTLLVPSEAIGGIDALNTAMLSIDSKLSKANIVNTTVKDFSSESNGRLHFSAVVTEIPKAFYRDYFTARSYVSYEINDEKFILYCDNAVTSSLYDAAKNALKNADVYTDSELEQFNVILQNS